jgi:PAS domain-containing protein
VQQIAAMPDDGEPAEMDKDENQMPDPRPEDALLFRPEWSRATLANIGDAVITTDTAGRVTFLNPVAESCPSGESVNS